MHMNELQKTTESQGLEKNSRDDEEKAKPLVKDKLKDNLNEIKLIGNIETISNILTNTKSDYIPGISILCENEEGWHKSHCFLPVHESSLLSNWFSYLARVLNLLKK